MVKDKEFARTRARYTSWLGNNNILMTYFAICVHQLFMCIPLTSCTTYTHIRTNACRNSSCGTLHNSICVINWQLTGAAIKISGHKIQLWPQQVHKQNTHAHIHTPAHAHMPHKIDTHPTHIQTVFSLPAPYAINAINCACIHAAAMRHCVAAALEAGPHFCYPCHTLNPSIRHSPNGLLACRCNRTLNTHAHLSHKHTLTHKATHAKRQFGWCEREGSGCGSKFSNIFGYFLTFLTSAKH